MYCLKGLREITKVKKYGTSICECGNKRNNLGGVNIPSSSNTLLLLSFSCCNESFDPRYTSAAVVFDYTQHTTIGEYCVLVYGEESSNENIEI